jgi:NADH-quinone oxidoreductase subunit J
MDLITIAFYFLAVLTVGFAAVVVFSKNIMYSAFALVFTLFGIAGLYVLLSADFMAVTQLMLYIGGILILIIFGVVITSRISGIDVKSGSLGRIQLGGAAVISLLMGVMLISIILSTNWYLAPSEEVNSTVTQIGNELLTKYLLAFEAASILLLLAIVGAAFIARKKK